MNAQEAGHTDVNRDPERVRSYHRARIGLFVVGILFSWVSSLLFLVTGASSKIARANRGAATSTRRSDGLTVSAFMLLSWIASLPLAYIRGYALEHRYDLSNQTRLGWLSDQLKGLAVQFVLLLPISQVGLDVIRRWPRHWWAILTAMAIPFTVLLTHLAPVLIAPLFNTYRPLRDQDLARRLTELAGRSGITVAEVLEMDMSRQTKKANAFFAGIGNTKRIVLADTMLDEFTPEEIETIVAHEIAHQAHRDLWRLLALGTVTTAAIAFTTQRLARRALDRGGHVMRIRSLGDVEALPLLGLTGSIVGALLIPLQNAISRYIERQADQYALRLSDDPDAFASALGRLQWMNLVDPEPPKIEEILLHSHPTISERIETCREYAHERRSA